MIFGFFRQPTPKSSGHNEMECCVCLSGENCVGAENNIPVPDREDMDYGQSFELRVTETQDYYKDRAPQRAGEAK